MDISIHVVQAPATWELFTYVAVTFDGYIWKQATNIVRSPPFENLVLCQLDRQAPIRLLSTDDNDRVLWIANEELVKSAECD